MQSLAILAVAVLLAVPCADAAERDGPDARVLAIADAYVADVFEERPGAVARLRPPGARYDRLPDDSLAGVAAREERRAAWLAELVGIDRSALAEPRARLAYDLARSRLEDGEALRVCGFERWLVSQMQNGGQIGYEEIVASRREAEARLGRGFELWAFHDAVLGGGSVTLPVLRERLQQWIETQEKATATATLPATDADSRPR